MKLELLKFRCVVAICQRRAAQTHSEGIDIGLRDDVHVFFHEFSFACGALFTNDVCLIRECARVRRTAERVSRVYFWSVHFWGHKYAMFCSFLRSYMDSL